MVVIGIAAIVVIPRVVFAPGFVLAAVRVRLLRVPSLARAAVDSFRLAPSVADFVLATDGFVASRGVVHSRDVLAVERLKIGPRTVVHVTRVRSVPDG